MNHQLQAIVRWQRTAQQIIVLALILMMLNAFAISKQAEAQDEVKLYESQIQTNSQNLQLIEPMYVKELKEVIAEMIRPFTMDEILQGVMSFKETPGFSTTRQRSREAPEKGKLAVVAYQISDNNSVSVFNGNGVFGQMGKPLSTLRLRFPEKQKNVNSFEFRLIEITFEESENSKYNGRFFIKDGKWYRIKHKSENKGITAAKDTEASHPSLQADIAFWNSIKDSTDPEPFQQYLSRFPNGTFVDLARQRISLAEAKEAATATVWIYACCNSLSRPSIFVDRVEIARLGEKRFITFRLPPGQHEFDCDRPGNDPKTIDLKPGTTMYLKVEFGWTKTRLKLVSEMQKTKESKGFAEVEVTSPRFQQRAKPQLTITSEPSGAQVEIDGEFIGDTPSTITSKEGSLSITIKKSGFQLWQRTLKVNPGDKRTVHAELVK